MPIDHVNALPPGKRFEEYRLDAVLGAGGRAFTWSMSMGGGKSPVADRIFFPNPPILVGHLSVLSEKITNCVQAMD